MSETNEGKYPPGLVGTPESEMALMEVASRALASRDGELAALRARVAELETVSLNGLVGDYAALRARAEAAEARANIAETDFWRLKNEAAAECSRLTDRVAALEAALAECRTKMEATKYSAPESPSLSSEAKLEQGTFNAAVDGCLSILDAARAGGHGT